MTDVPPGILDRLQSICLALPDAYQEPAWIGTRWRIRKRTFAHAVMVAAGSTGAFARVAGAETARAVVTFRASVEEVEALSNAGHPFYFAGWGRDVLGVVLEDDTDWDEVEELLTESYCVLAPAKLVAKVERPPE